MISPSVADRVPIAQDSFWRDGEHLDVAEELRPVADERSRDPEHLAVFPYPGGITFWRTREVMEPAHRESFDVQIYDTVAKSMAEGTVSPRLPLPGQHGIGTYEAAQRCRKR